MLSLLRSNAELAHTGEFKRAGSDSRRAASPSHPFGSTSHATAAAARAASLLERDEAGTVRGAQAGPAVQRGLVGDGELAQVLACGRYVGDSW
jgi:hypothetical protein